MSDAPFLDAIRAAPADDGPRLVYADWLEERGDPRGEFIRLQCEHAHLGEDDPRQPARAARVELLLHDHGEVWRAHLPGWVNGCEFRRGFPHTVRARVRDFVDGGADLFAAEPLITGAAFDVPIAPRNGGGGEAAVRRDLANLARSPSLRQLTELSLSGSELRLPADALPALVGSPRLADLRQLRLDNLALGDFRWPGPGDGLPHFRLHRLALSGCGLTFEAVARLTAQPFLAELAELNLSHNPL